MNNRGGGIRTHDPSVPNAVRYQAALRPDFFKANYIAKQPELFIKKWRCSFFLLRFQGYTCF